MSLFTLSQILISIAIISDLISFQFKEKRHIVTCFIISCSLISLHFMCLGHWTAAALGILALGRFTASLYTTSRSVMFLFIGAALLIGAFTYDGYLTLISCSATVFGTFASFCNDDKPLRKLMAIGTTLWIIHNFMAGSPGAVILETIFLGSNLVGYFRYYIRPKQTATT